MKKILTAWLIVAALVLPMNVYAQDETTASMTVAYDYTAPSDGETENTPTYILEIPSYFVTQDMNVVTLYADKNDIPMGKKITVSVDGDNSYDNNGYFYLYKDKDQPNQEAIWCRVYYYTDNTLTTLKLADISKSNNLVAEFAAGSKLPTYGGYLCFEPLTEFATGSSGYYMGVLYFNIQVVDV